MLPTRDGRPFRSRFTVTLARALVVAVALGAAVDARAEPLVYALAQPSRLGTFDIASGTFTEIGVLEGIDANGGFGDIARLPGGKLYSQFPDQRLAAIDPDTALPEYIGETGDNAIFSLSFRHDGVLFGISLTDLYTIDLATAQATRVGSFEVETGRYYDIAFDAEDNLFMTRGTGSRTELFRVNAETGAATLIGSTEFNVMATDFVEGTLYGFTTNKQLLTIDTASGAATLVTSYPDFIFGVATLASAAVGGGGNRGGGNGGGGNGGGGGSATLGGDGGLAGDGPREVGGAAGTDSTSAGSAGASTANGGTTGGAGNGGSPIPGGGATGGAPGAAGSGAASETSSTGGRSPGGAGSGGTSTAGGESGASTGATDTSDSGHGCIAAGSNADPRQAFLVAGGFALALCARRRRSRPNIGATQFFPPGVPSKNARIRS